MRWARKGELSVKLVGKGEDVVNNDGNADVINEDSELPHDSFVSRTGAFNAPNAPILNRSL